MFDSIKKFMTLFVLVFLCALAPALLKKCTRGFKLAKLHVTYPASSAWEVSGVISKESAVSILKQPFHFLGKGAQCYAFESADRRYVLKVFRFDRKNGFRKKRSRQNSYEKIEALFNGCVLALTFAPEQTGLLYLHLNETQEEFSPIYVSSPIGHAVRLPLDQFRFALQKKAIPFLEAFLEAKDQGMIEQRVNDLVSLLEERIKKGIGNRDPNLWRNFGFLDDRAIEIDFGNYTQRDDFVDASNARAELERYAESLRSWLRVNCPEYISYLDKRIDETVF